MELHWAAVDDFTPEQADAKRYAQQWLQERNGALYQGIGAAPDFADTGETHHWSHSAMQRVGIHKDGLIKVALDHGYDAIWFVDADLLLDPYTFRSLYACNAPITCGVYWTRWHQGTPEQVIHAAPQVWLTHPYGLEGRGYEAHEFRQKLLDRGLTQVWGQGACTLIRREALEKGVNFAPLPDLPTEGMWQGEDRHFCVKAERLHLPMYADSWPDIFHVYHPSDIARIPEFLHRFAARAFEAEQASVGDLVSLSLEAIEPIPFANGWSKVGPQVVRGRLGVLSMMPELEEVVQDMKKGETRIVPLHGDVGHPLPFRRGARFLVRVTLHDHRPYGFPPVVEDEMYRGIVSKRHQDMTRLFAHQHDQIAEAAGAVSVA